jgi:hypothetical protein
LWSTIAKKKADGTLLENWSTPVRMSGLSGADGAPGVPGERGADGTILYTWIKYADNASGGGLSDSPTGKTYIGFAYNKTTATESNTASDYIWSLLKGTDGVPGANGVDGQATYTWIKYGHTSADIEAGNIYDQPDNETVNIGIAVNKTTATESNDWRDYVWSKFKGDRGETGAAGRDGRDGAAGPALVYTGAYNSTKEYHGTSLRIEAVKSGSTYYVTRVDAGTFSGKTPTNTAYWNSFGASFESIATELLLAEMANIADWIIKDNKITSPKGLKQVEGVWKEVTVDSSTGIQPYAQLSGQNAGIEFRRLEGTSVQTIKLTAANGLYLNDSQNSVKLLPENMYAYSVGGENPYFGAGIKSVISAKMQTVIGATGVNCAIMGMPSTSTSITPVSYGGYFIELMAAGLNLATKRIASTGQTLTHEDTYISCNNSSTLTLYLPIPRAAGKVFFIRKTQANIILDAQTVGGAQMQMPDGQIVNSYQVTVGGELLIVVWDGVYWQYSRTLA